MKEVYKQTIRVETLAETEIHKENVEKTVYKLTGHDSEKISKVVVTSPNPFLGVTPGALVDLTIGSSQMSLEEFDPEAADKRTSNKSGDQEQLEKDLKGKKK